MNRLFSAGALLALSACSMTSTVDVSVAPQLNATLADDVKLLARADTSNLTCKVFEAGYEAGRFSLEGLCKDTDYTLSLTDPSLLIVGDVTVSATGEPLAVDLELWPAPAGDGMSMLSKDGTLAVVGKYTDVQKVFTDDEAHLPVRYPRHKPNGSHHATDGSHLVLAGQPVIERLAVLPLIETTEERGFDGYTLGAHWFAGIKFASDTDYEIVTAELDASRVKDVTDASGRVVRYIAHDALPPGHYALMGPEDRRMFVVTFGPQAAEAAASN